MEEITQRKAQNSRSAPQRKNCSGNSKKMEAGSCHLVSHSGKFTPSPNTRDTATGSGFRPTCSAYSDSAKIAGNGTGWTSSSPANGAKTTTTPPVCPPDTPSSPSSALPASKHPPLLRPVPSANRNSKAKQQNANIVSTCAILNVFPSPLSPAIGALTSGSTWERGSRSARLRKRCWVRIVTFARCLR